MHFYCLIYMANTQDDSILTSTECVMNSTSNEQDMSEELTLPTITTELALIVNNCRICKLEYTVSKTEHYNSELHRFNLKQKTPMTVDQYCKHKHILPTQLSIYKVGTGYSKLVMMTREQETSLREGKLKLDFKVISKERVVKSVDIKQRIQEHSHNNHHGLPGANKYAHRGPESTPGKNHMFRNKKN